MRHIPTSSLLLAALLPTLLGAQALPRSSVQERKLQPADPEQLQQAPPDLTATPEDLQVDPGTIATPTIGEKTPQVVQDTTVMEPRLQDAAIEREGRATREQDARAIASIPEESSDAFRVIDLPSTANLASTIRAELRAGQSHVPADSFVVGRLPIGPQRLEELELTDPSSADELRKAVEDILGRPRLAPGGGSGFDEGDASQTRSQLAKHQDDSRAWMLPYQFVGRDKAGTALNLQPIIVVDAGGLRPAAGGSFWGRIFAGVLDADRPGESHAIGQTITFLITGDLDRVNPQSISFDLTNHFEQVDLAADSPPDPVRLQVRPTFDPEGQSTPPIEIPVLRGAIRLTVSPIRIQGLGLETARVSVQALGVPKPDHLSVDLSSDLGSLDPGTLSFDASGLASTTIRSVTTGTATLHAASISSLAPGEATVTFLFPWLFLGAALLGGGAGGLIRRARTDPGKRRAFWMDLLILGVLVGLVIACAYSVGINLLPFQPTAHAGETLVFALAALGAIFGIPKAKSNEP